MNRLGLPVTQFGGISVRYGEDTLALAVYFGGDLSPSEMRSIKAVVVATNGEVTVLPAFGEHSNPADTEHARVWPLDPAPPKGAVLQLRTGTNATLVEMRLE